jgi:uncharacterized protein
MKPAMEYEEQYFKMEISGVAIDAALTTPKGMPPRWGIVLAPGSYFNDVNGNYSQKDGNPFEFKPNTIAHIARQLACRGHSVLRYARSGRVVLDDVAAVKLDRFIGRVDEVAGAYRTLRERVPQIQRLALAGHSEGASVCLLLLTTRTDMQVDAYVSLSGPGKRFFDVILDACGAALQDGMVVLGTQRMPVDLYRRSIELVRLAQPIPEEMRRVLPPFGVHAMTTKNQDYLRDYDQLNPLTAAAQVTAPMMIVQGSKDTSVSPDNARLLQMARQYSATFTRVAMFSDLNHFYKHVPPNTPHFANFMLEGETDTAVALAISDWLHNLDGV